MLIFWVNESSQMPHKHVFNFNFIFKLHLEKSPVWQAYLIIIEILTRLGPTGLMIVLNIAIIRGFYESIQRKKILRAKRFLQRSESQLVNNKSSKFLRSSKGKR